MPIDARGFNLVSDAQPFANGIGSLLTQQLVQGTAQKAMTGDKEAFAKLAVQDPRAAGQIGGILQDQREVEMQRQQMVQEMSYRVARGFAAAKDKAGYLTAAANQLRAAGLDDVAAEVLDDANTYASNPAAVEQEYSAIVGMFAEPDKGLTEYQRQSLDLQRQRLEKTPFEKATANVQDYEYYKKLKQTDPQGAEMFAKDVGLIPKDKQLSPTGEKTLIDAQDKYFSSTTQAREYELLAGDFERFSGSLPSGSKATISEFIKTVAGSQDDATELRRRLAKVRLSEALKYLPPGPATDRDVKEAFKGVPAENASPTQVQAFLRGSAKMARIDSEFQEFKANYIAENEGTKGLIPAWKKAIADGNVASINELRQEGSQKQDRYSVGQIIEVGGKRYRVTGGDPSDPDVEPVQ